MTRKLQLLPGIRLACSEPTATHSPSLAADSSPSEPLSDQSEPLSDQSDALAPLSTDAPMGGWADAEGLERALQALLAADDEWPARPRERAAVSVVAEEDGGGATCRYRRGKCGQPRTRKRSGALHSFCELHRQRSVANQKRFDQKRRFERLLQRAVDDEHELERGEEDGEGETRQEDGSQTQRRERKRRKTIPSLEDDRSEYGAGGEHQDLRYDIAFITGSSVVL